MNKTLLFSSLLILHYTSKAQVADTIIISDHADTNKHMSCGLGKAEVITLHPFISDYTEYNLTRIIDGRVTGTQTTNGGGQPGTSAEMLIRGMSSLSDNNAPLIVLDGIPFYGDLSTINSDDIRSITIQKDAVTTFDFGNRGGNGIVNIVTNDRFRDINPQSKLQVNVQFGITSQALPDYNTLDPKAYYETMYAAMQNAGLPGNVVDYLGGYNAYHIDGIGNNLQNNYLIDPATGKLNPGAKLKYQDNWRKEMRRIGIRQNYNVASSARNKKGGYYLSVGYLNDKGYVKQTDYTRYTARFNGDYSLLKWLTVGLRTQGVTGNQHIAPESLFRSAQLMPSVYPVYYRNADDAKEKMR